MSKKYTRIKNFPPGTCKAEARLVFNEGRGMPDARRAVLCDLWAEREQHLREIDAYLATTTGGDA